MLGRVSEKVLTLLQLTRMALVFTAVSNALAALALRAGATPRGVWGVRPTLVVATVCVAVGLYGFGMALNDIIDRRRDEHLARGRPLPSGRIGVGAAVVVAALLLGLAVFGGLVFYRRAEYGAASLTLVFLTASLICLYDFAGKYLVWAGLLLLGLIRFFHAEIVEPTLPVVWHPLFLLNHVAIISAVAYRWEAKRPHLSRSQAWLLGGGLVLLDVALVTVLFYRRGRGFAESLQVTPALIGPCLAAVAFAVFGHYIKTHANDRRAAGRALILYGLLWLIMYDALFVVGYVDWRLGALLLLLWPVAYLAVRAMRVWASVTDLARKPEYIRADA